MKVQQELMRPGSIQTTMNIYGQAMSNSEREANSKVVERMLKPGQGERQKPGVLLTGVSGRESEGMANRKSVPST
ncbi:MAG TPA: hypothetical protein VHX60_01440 [Acidobacteriaceae bacterium]|jgi:hypothetical protein|nr:hypothetical protein [Acidobacteriaceae bacterium]